MEEQTIQRGLKRRLLSLLEISRLYLLAAPLYAGLGHILIFHRVCPNDGKEKLKWIKGIEVTPGYLEGVVRYFLDHGYDVISLDQLAGRLTRQERGKKFVVFTFDDGYADNYTYAYPVLKKFNIPFTIYVTTGFVDRQAIMWEHELNDLIFNNNELSFKVNDKKFEYNCSTIDEKEVAYLNVRSFIRDGDGNECLSRIKNILGPYRMDTYKKSDELALTWDQLKEINSDPLVTIGAHSVNHWSLKGLSLSSARNEMLESKKRIELMLNCEIQHFSFPYGGRGDAGEREFELAKECNFQTATTTRSANIFLSHRDHLECLPRFDMGGEINRQKLRFLSSGISHCINNRFKRVITV